VSKLTDFRSYADAMAHFSNCALWELFDGTRDKMNIAHECIDRHAKGDEIAAKIARADGGDEIISFAEISRTSSQVAHYLRAAGVVRGARVAVMIEPSLAI
jgi:acetyl-CoA synthetase